MEPYVRPPEPLSANGDMAENWQRWKKDFLTYLKVSDYEKKSKDVQAYLLRQHIGEVGQKRYNFFTTSWTKNVSIEAHINYLKKKATTCNFGTMANSLIRDKIIANIKDKNLLKKLFETKNLDLLKLVSIYNEHIKAVQEKKESSTKDIANVENVKGVVNSNDINAKVITKNQPPSNTENKRNCSKCNQKHAIKSCPAWGWRCAKCGDRNHFPVCCTNVTAHNLQKETNKNNITPHNQHNPNSFPQRQQVVHPLMQNNNMRVPSPYQYNNGPNMIPSASSFPHTNSVYPNFNTVMNAGQTPVGLQQWQYENPTPLKSNESFQKNAPMQHLPSAPTEKQITTNIKTTTHNKPVNGKNKEPPNNCVIS
ncbi:uncharacterized protein LOC122394848 isoform X2 [Colletes gigas]|uniref:uncharacterized protein LOC122394848 isoform X2 n=1 Tax=Colletes gigas TaxID=935657 RepID=UPI001C9B64F4|nr:uncharacterized protein LOC122394848 isoform X2 [Colletes gigas]